MPLMGDTGNGTTFTLGTQSITLALTSVDIGEETIEMLDVSTLATTAYMEKLASDLKDAGQVTVNYFFSTTANKVAVGAAPETGTITFPLRSGESAAANLAGTGVVVSNKLPSLENGVVQAGTLVFEWDGDTGPTYTKATAS